MNITVTAERPESDKVVATITVPAAEVDKAIANTYKEVAAKYNFQGFRKGHAPRPVIDGIVGRDAILAQATEDIVNDAQPAAFEQLDIVPVDRPSYGEDAVVAVEHEDLVLVATINVPPTCELDSYDAPAINMPPQNATEAEIDQQIEQLLSYHVSFEDETEERAVVEGDVVVLDVENKEGAPELAGTDRQFGLGNAYLPSEFVAGVVGMNKGEQKDISWTQTHGDHEHSFAVSVTLKGLKKTVTPELDDEFAKKSFGFDTVAELRDAVKEEIENDKKTSLPALKEDRVVEEIGKHLTLDEVPEAYQNQVFSELANEFLGSLGRQGMNLDMYLAARQIKSEDFLNDLHEQAAERARQSLALDALAAKLGFEATEDDVKAEFERANVEDVEKSMKEFTESGQMPAIRESIRRTKAVNWLVENASVTEVDEIAEARAKKDSE
ncbi:MULTISPECIES: trigger factor [Atopobiaceae]|uniref:Trigger factor n=1 Tax=Parafannyhessea umbonata TaxID=604330 RepID=A0A1H6K6U0_9ACTN|nr:MULTISPECIES: trigger factor [Atopobiaceae]SEH70926.1 trigger factor [Parafannyhessea umbonata]SJZ53239.1 trigger factor [Olsenella sp. KH1P3]